MVKAMLSSWASRRRANRALLREKNPHGALRMRVAVLMAGCALLGAAALGMAHWNGNDNGNDHARFEPAPARPDHPGRGLQSSATCDADPGGSGDAVLLLLASLYLFVGLAIVCDEFFVPSLELISEKLQLTEDVAGATFMAAGSSAPELFTSVADSFGPKNSLGVGTIVGSAMFNILVIVALAAAAAKATLKIDWRPLLRDAFFYLFSLALMVTFILTPTRGQVEWHEGMIMVLGYLCYVVWMYFNPRIFAKCEPAEDGAQYHMGGAAKIEPETLKDIEKALDEQKKEKDSDAKDEETSTPLVDASASQDAEDTSEPEPRLRRGSKRWVQSKRASRVSADGMAPLKEGEGGVAGAHDVTGSDSPGTAKVAPTPDQVKPFNEPEAPQGSGGTGATPEGKGAAASDGDEAEGAKFKFLDAPDADASLFDKLLFYISVPWLFLFTFTIPDCGEEKHQNKYVLAFVCSILWIGGICWFMVDFATVIGCILDIDPPVMGIVVLAVGTSVPDALASMIVAREGEADMAIANAVGSNVFDILLGLGIPWWIVGLIDDEPTPVNVDGIELGIGILFGTVVLFVGSIVLNKFRMNPTLGVVFLIAYILYILFTLLAEYCVLDIKTACEAA